MSLCSMVTDNTGHYWEESTMLRKPLSSFRGYENSSCFHKTSTFFPFQWAHDGYENQEVCVTLTNCMQRQMWDTSCPPEWLHRTVQPAGKTTETAVREVQPGRARGALCARGILVLVGLGAQATLDPCRAPWLVRGTHDWMHQWMTGDSGLSEELCSLWGASTLTRPWLRKVGGAQVTA